MILQTVLIVNFGHELSNNPAAFAYADYNRQLQPICLYPSFPSKLARVVVIFHRLLSVFSVELRCVAPTSGGISSSAVVKLHVHVPPLSQRPFDLIRFGWNAKVPHVGVIIAHRSRVYLTVHRDIDTTIAWINSLIRTSFRCVLAPSPNTCSTEWPEPDEIAISPLLLDQNG